MEALVLLEKKVKDLVDLIKVQKDEIVRLAKEREEAVVQKEQVQKEMAQLQENYLFLQQTVENLEASLMSGKEELDHEKELTKMFVDGLLKNIDSIAHNEQ